MGFQWFLPDTLTFRPDTLTCRIPSRVFGQLKKNELRVFGHVKTAGYPQFVAGYPQLTPDTLPSRRIPSSERIRLLENAPPDTLSFKNIYIFFVFELKNIFFQIISIFATSVCFSRCFCSQRPSAPNAVHHILYKCSLSRICALVYLSMGTEMANFTSNAKILIAKLA